MKPSTIHPRGAASPIVFIGLAVIVLLLSWWGTKALSSAKTETEAEPAGAAPTGMPPANVILSQVEKKLSQQTQRVIGTLRAKFRSKLAAREAGARVGFVLMATILGMALGGWVSGQIYDWTGSYEWAFINGIIWNGANIAIILWLLNCIRNAAFPASVRVRAA